MAEGSRPTERGLRGEDRYYADEVSLRELYLIFRRGLPLIIVVAVVCAVAAFALASLRSESYEATASVNVIPPFVGTDSLSGLELSVTAGIDEESYEEIAYSPALLTEVGEPYGYTALELSNLVTMTARAAPSQTRGHLVVDHKVTIAGDEGLQSAANLANDWAHATVAVVSDALSSHLTGAVETVNAEIAERRAAYQAASDAWADFLAHDDRLAIEAQLAQLATSATPVGEQVGALRTRLAELEREAATLEREVSTASLVYFRVAPTGPALELQRNLAAGSVFIAIPATTPVMAEAVGSLLLTLSAALIGGLLATLVVFFRAAVKER